MQGDLDSWDICDPQIRQDILPQPYRLIDEVLHETILLKLSLAMYEIDSKSKDINYEGLVKQYKSNSTIDQIQISSIISSTNEGNISFNIQCKKNRNYSVLGDRKGNVYLIDLHKKAIIDKMQIECGRRIINISEYVLYDNEQSMVMVGIVMNNCNRVQVIGYRCLQLKLYRLYQIKLQHIPYQCEIVDWGRLVIVKLFNGNILLYILPQLQFQFGGDQNQIKDKKYNPLQYVLFPQNTQLIHQINFFIEFKGVKVTKKYNELIKNIQERKKQIIPQTNKKDTKKTDKKPQVQPPKIPQQQLLTNSVIQAPKLQVINGMDFSQQIPQPHFKPFISFLNGGVTLASSKYFQKPKKVQLISNFIYGWTNTLQFYRYKIKEENIFDIPECIQLQEKKKDRKRKDQKICVEPTQINRILYEITVVEIEEKRRNHMAVGMRNGTISIWNIRSMRLQDNIERHNDEVRMIRWFEGWKIISGSRKGQIHIYDVINKKLLMKRTHVFEREYSIDRITINELGLGYICDNRGNMRVYDLWRNNKIIKLYGIWNNICYSNNDYTILVREKKIGKCDGKEEIDGKKIDRQIHIIRNFQMILQIFEGLESVYKKGYQRKKVQNIFTNLQFGQLNDRNFDIPNWSQQIQKVQTKRLLKPESSLRSKMSDISYGGSKTSNQISQSKKGSIKVKLTNEILHPEKFLFERRKIALERIINEQELMMRLLEEHRGKIRRENIIQNDIKK